MERWRPMTFRGQRVWVRCDEEDQPVVRDGRAEMRYREDRGKVYRASVRNLAPVASVLPPATPPLDDPEATRFLDPPNVLREVPVTGRRVLAYTDGACTGNPGPAGLGVVIEVGGRTVEYQEPLGSSTNNRAELAAILRAFQLLRGRAKSVVVFTDSSYAKGVVEGSLKPKRNLDLIAAVRTEMAKQPHRFEKVEGHAGVAGNEHADALAREALTRTTARQSTRTSQSRTNR